MLTLTALSWYFRSSDRKIISGNPLGITVQRLRERKKIKQEIMAEKLGITQPAYSRIEKGDTKMTTEKLEKIAQALDMTPEEIYEEDRKIVITHNHNKDTGSVFYNNFSSTEKDLYEKLLAEKDKQLQEKDQYIQDLRQTNQELKEEIRELKIRKTNF